MFGKSIAKKEKGFTLIEIISVMALLSILAVVFVPNVLGYFKEAKKTEVLKQARMVVLAAESWGVKIEKVGATLDGLDVKVASVSGVKSLIEEIDDEDMLGLSDVNKLPEDITVGQCRKILDTKNYNFSIDSNGVATNLP